MPTSKGRKPARKPTPKGGRPGSTAGRSTPPARAELERRSLPVLARLAALPRWTILVGTLTLMVLGLVLPGLWGALFLAVLAVGLVWLLTLSWPIIPTPQKVFRVFVAGFIVAYALLKATGKV